MSIYKFIYTHIYTWRGVDIPKHSVYAMFTVISSASARPLIMLHDDFSVFGIQGIRKRTCFRYLVYYCN